MQSKSLKQWLVAALLFAVPLAVMAGWSATASCYKQNGMQGGASYSVTDGNETAEGSVELDSPTYSGAGSWWWARYPRAGGMEWEQYNHQYIDYVTASFGTLAASEYFMADCRCGLLDSDAEVLADA